MSGGDFRRDEKRDIQQIEPVACWETEKDFSSKQLSTIPDGIFDKCTALEEIDFSYNRIKTFHVSLFSHLVNVRSFNLEKNNIETVSFRSLFPLSDCSEINLTDQNQLYNSKSLYSLMFQQLPRYSLPRYDWEKISDNFDFYYKKFNSLFSDSKFCIIRNNLVVEKNFLVFYLSSKSLSSKSLKSLKSKFDSFESKR